MIRERRHTRAVLSLVLTLLVTGASFVPTLLERDADVRVSLESAHDPSHCPRVHDHSVCTQIKANQGVPGVPVRSAAMFLVAAASENEALPDVRQTVLTSHPPSRAPPA